MKKAFSTLARTALLATAVFILAACGGGGGGGGTGSTQPPDSGTITNPPSNQPDNPPSTPSAADNIFSIGQKVVAIGVRPGSAGTLTKTADGLTVSYMSERTTQLSAAAGDFSDTGDVITAIKDSSGTYASYPNLSYSVRDTVLLGGRKTGLSYSEFGLWSLRETRTNTNDGTSSINYGATAFHMGDPDRAAGFTPGSAALSFSGKSISMVQGHGSSMAQLLGTATITLNTGNLANSNLRLEFADFYNFDLPINISTSGGITQQTGTVAISPNGTNTTGISVSNISTSLVNGQFYGPSADTPSEAAGNYFLQTNDSTGFINIHGSFGVKQ